MTTSESKGRFFLQNESIRIDSNRELGCSNRNAYFLNPVHAHTVYYIFLSAPCIIFCIHLIRILINIIGYQLLTGLPIS